MMVENLDIACAELGAKLGASGNKDTENSITKALGVLEEQGVYALFLYLIARENGKFVPDLLQFMEERCEFRNGHQLYQKLVANGSREAFFKALTDHAEDLDTLLFTRDLLHRALVYARYHAKAAQAGGAKTP